MEKCIFRPSVGILPFKDSLNKVLFPTCTSIWRVNNYGSRQGKVQIGETNVLLFLYKFVAFWSCTFY